MGMQARNQQRKLEDPATVLRQAWEMFDRDDLSALQAWLWDHERLRLVVTEHARGGISAEQLVALLADNVADQEALRTLLTTQPQIPQMLPLIVRVALIRPTSHDQKWQVTIPAEFAAAWRE